MSDRTSPIRNSALRRFPFRSAAAAALALAMAAGAAGGSAQGALPPVGTVSAVGANR